MTRTAAADGHSEAGTRIRSTPGILGRRTEIDGRDAITTRPGEIGHVTWGPYERREAGRYRIEFDVGIAGEIDVLGDPVAVTLEVTTGKGKSYLVDRRLLCSQLSRGIATIAQEFTLDANRELEYRVRSSGQVGLNVAIEGRLVRLDGGIAKRPKRGSVERALDYEQEFLDGYLRNVSGLIHVGAHLAQERRYYWLIGVDVLWVEPIPENYEKVIDNLAKYPHQRCVNALLADVDGRKFELRIANNGGSSSIFDLQDHKKIFPHIEYVAKHSCVSLTLDTLMEREGVSTDDYQALTLDVEGAELLVLKGAKRVLRGFQYVKCEVADFPVRADSPNVAQLDALLSAAGFKELSRRQFALGPERQGTYWDVVWKRAELTSPFAPDSAYVPMVAHPMEVSGVEKNA